MEEIKKTPALPLEKLDTKYKLIIPSWVEQKIRHLCNRVWSKEWSGTLFYKVEGSFEDGSLTVTCVDIFVMDIGNVTYTEFDMSPDVITYMTEHPELMDCQLGLIHSHNNMATFFSGTDTATLKEEGRDRNHFVSLIVNNAGTYTAAITRKVDFEREVTEKGMYESFDGVIVETPEESFKETESVIQYFYLDIEKEGTSYSFLDVDARLKEIEQSKAKVAKATSTIPSYTPSGNYGKDWKAPEVPSKETPKVIQPSLPFDTDFMDSEPIRVVTEESAVEGVSADPKLIKYLCLQLLLGSALVSEDSKVDINKWVNSLQVVVERRFGKGKEGLDLYESYIESMVEFLVWNTSDPTLVNMVDSDYMATIIAEDMISYLSKLPQNTYVEVCQKALLNYM